MFFFKQETAYEMGIRYWSSDVCSSDLLDLVRLLEEEAPGEERERALPPSSEPAPAPAGEPTNAEMVESVRDWIEGSIKPGSQGHAKFEAVVAMNALGIEIGRASCRERVCQYV